MLAITIHMEANAPAINWTANEMIATIMGLLLASGALTLGIRFAWKRVVAKSSADRSIGGTAQTGSGNESESKSAGGDLFDHTRATQQLSPQSSPVIHGNHNTVNYGLPPGPTGDEVGAQRTLTQLQQSIVLAASTAGGLVWMIAPSSGRPGVVRTSTTAFRALRSAADAGAALQALTELVSWGYIAPTDQGPHHYTLTANGWSAGSALQAIQGRPLPGAASSPSTGLTGYQEWLLVEIARNGGVARVLSIGNGSTLMSGAHVLVDAATASDRSRLLRTLEELMNLELLRHPDAHRWELTSDGWGAPERITSVAVGIELSEDERTWIKRATQPNGTWLRRIREGSGWTMPSPGFDIRVDHAEGERHLSVLQSLVEHGMLVTTQAGTYVPTDQGWAVAARMPAA